MPIEQLADTALLTAFARVVESDRVDALFRDVHARQLAGARGAALAHECAAFQTMVNAIACRTAVFDELIVQIIRDKRIDLVVNLAAGLDTRPWRLPLPRELRWIDIDLPSVLDHKRLQLAGCEAYCGYGQQPADITNAEEFDRALAGIDNAQRTLFVSEGLLIYMSEEEVAYHAGRLRAVTAAAWWVTDLAGRRALGMMTSAWGQVLQGAKFQFAPMDPVAFFQRVGWEEAEFRSSHEEGRRLGRVRKRSWLGRAALALTTLRFREEVRRLSGVAVLHRRASEAGGSEDRWERMFQRPGIVRMRYQLENSMGDRPRRGKSRFALLPCLSGGSLYSERRTGEAFSRSSRSTNLSRT